MSGDPQAVARDWITIWQSELHAAAADRELLEGLRALVDHWAQAAQAAAAFLPGADDAQGGCAQGGWAQGGCAQGGWAGAGAPAGAAAAAAAPDARDAVIERLAERVAALERVIAGLRGS